MQRLHATMEEEMSSRQARFEAAGGVQDTSRMWDLITAVAEASFVNFLELQGADAARMKGRSKVTIISQQDQGEPAEPKSCTKRGQELKRNAGKHYAQANRLTNVARRIKCACAAGITKERKRANLEQNNDTVAAYLTQAAVSEVIPSKVSSANAPALDDCDCEDDRGSRVSKKCRESL